MEVVFPHTTPNEYSHADGGLDLVASRAPRRVRRKYTFTDQIDRLIREVYLSRPDSKTRSGIRELAKRVGIPHWALKKRARELGLARTKELPWSEPELEILARYAWMSDERLRLKLKAAGHARTATAIHLKVKRMSFKSRILVNPLLLSAIQQDVNCTVQLGEIVPDVQPDGGCARRCLLDVWFLDPEQAKTEIPSFLAAGNTSTTAHRYSACIREAALIGASSSPAVHTTSRPPCRG